MVSSGLITDFNFRFHMKNMVQKNLLEHIGKHESKEFIKVYAEEFNEQFFEQLNLVTSQMLVEIQERDVDLMQEFSCPDGKTSA